MTQESAGRRDPVWSGAGERIGDVSRNRTACLHGRPEAAWPRTGSTTGHRQEVRPPAGGHNSGRMRHPPGQSSGSLGRVPSSPAARAFRRHNAARACMPPMRAVSGPCCADSSGAAGVAGWLEAADACFAVASDEGWRGARCNPAFGPALECARRAVHASAFCRDIAEITGRHGCGDRDSPGEGLVGPFPLPARVAPHRDTGRASGLARRRFAASATAQNRKAAGSGRWHAGRSVMPSQDRATRGLSLPLITRGAAPGPTAHR